MTLYLLTLLAWWTRSSCCSSLCPLASSTTGALPIFLGVLDAEPNCSLSGVCSTALVNLRTEQAFDAASWSPSRLDLYTTQQLAGAGQRPSCKVGLAELVFKRKDLQQESGNRGILPHPFKLVWNQAKKRECLCAVKESDARTSHMASLHFIEVLC